MATQGSTPHLRFDGLSQAECRTTTDRAELAKLIKRLEPEDLLIVTRLDRLARSTRDLLNILASIAEARAGFKSLHDKWADSTSPHGRLSLTVLGGLAEFERELIRARTGEGRKRAQERGVRFGRPAALTSHQRHEARQRLCDAQAEAGVNDGTETRPVRYWDR